MIKLRLPFLLLLAVAPGSSLFARDTAPSQLPPDARVAIVGDSITEQKQYSKFIETYLLACLGRKDITCFQFGWSGETAAGFKVRLENDLSVFNPTVVTLCYGMNDGRYVPYAEAIGADYESNMRSVVTKLQAIGVKNMVIGAPGAVDTKYFGKPGGTTPAQYNDNLAHLGAINQKLATESKQAFANVHDTMTEAMSKAKVTHGDDYDVCGKDGVHPGVNGQLLMAMAILKGLGCDGNIGEITVDLKGQSTVSAGHKVIGGSGASIELESTTWPFCFDADPKASSSTRSILPFCSFNDDLNRFTLRVKNLTAAKAKVTWGTESKEFTKEQLTQGINLAVEFPKTPFDEAFMKFMSGVGGKQAYETPMIKGMVTQFRNFTADIKEDAEFASALETLKKKMMGKQQKLDTEARKNLGPVKHKLTVEAQ